MKMHPLLGFLALTTLIAACSNDDENGPGNQLNETVFCDYAPYSVGSTFVFENKTKDQLTGDYQTSTASNEVVEITDYLGHTWAVIDGQQQFGDGAQGLVRCNEEGVTLLAKTLEVNGQLVTDFEFPVLRLPATVGKTWASETISFDVMGFTNNLRYDFEITATGLTQTVSGATYTDVLEVQETAITEIDGFPPISSTVTYRYYDQQTGLIKSVITTQSFFGADTLLVSELVDFDIQ